VLLEGESLFNDASSIVLFEVTLNPGPSGQPGSERPMTLLLMAFWPPPQAVTVPSLLEAFLNSQQLSCFHWVKLTIDLDP
jgi:hypothetical protein